MGFIDTLGRIPKILEANVNAVLDKCEDPAKMIDQLLVDYRRDLADVKKSTVKVMADEKIARQRLEECDTEIEKVTMAAKNALLANNEGDASKLIERKQKLESTRASLADNYAVCQKNVELMREGYNKLVSDIEDLEQRKDAAKAKIALAKAQKGINKMSEKAYGTVSFERFEKYEKMAEQMLAEADSEVELNAHSVSTDELVDKYSTVGGKASVEAEVARMKAELGL